MKKTKKQPARVVKGNGCPHQRSGWCLSCVDRHLELAAREKLALVDEARIAQSKWDAMYHSHVEERAKRQQLEHVTGVGAAKNVAVSVLMLGNPKRVDGGHVWLALRSDTAKVFPGMQETGGGKVDPGETVMQTAIREMQEETGITFTEDRFTHWGVVRCKHETDLDVAVYLFMVTLGEDEWPKHTEPDKRSDWCHFDPNSNNDFRSSNTTPATLALLAIARANRRGVRGIDPSLNLLA